MAQAAVRWHYGVGGLSSMPGASAAAAAAVPAATRRASRAALLARRFAISPAAISSMLLTWSGIDFPKRSRTLNFEANATARARIERARLLASAGLDDWAVNELRYGAQNEDQPQVLAIELASITAKSVGPDQAMRYIKRYAGNYLYMPVESAPAQFWKLAFPLPYRADLERFWGRALAAYAADVELATEKDT